MPDPLWRRTADDLRQKIESGDLGAGGKALPSEVELQDMYRASRNTIRDAVKWLTTQNLVETRPGQGTFVTQRIDPFVTEISAVVDATPGGEGAAYDSEVTKESRKPQTSDPKIEIQKASGLVTNELGLAETETIVSRHQERYIDGTPWSLQTTYYPMSLVTRGATKLIQAETILPGAVQYIESALGIKRIGRRDTFTVRAPDRRETEFFGLRDVGGVAIVEFTQTYYDGSREPFVVTVTTYPADRNRFVMTIGEAPAVPPGSAAEAAPAEPVG